MVLMKGYPREDSELHVWVACSNQLVEGTWWRNRNALF